MSRKSRMNLQRIIKFLILVFAVTLFINCKSQELRIIEKESIRGYNYLYEYNYDYGKFPSNFVIAASNGKYFDLRSLSNEEWFYDSDGKDYKRSYIFKNGNNIKMYSYIYSQHSRGWFKDTIGASLNLSDAFATAKKEGGVVISDLEGYKRANGKYPGSLQELIDTGIKVFEPSIETRKWVYESDGRNFSLHVLLAGGSYEGFYYESWHGSWRNDG